MNSNDQILNNLFNNLSSIYNKDNGMLNSNLYTLFNAYATVLGDIERKNTQVKNNTYITTAGPDALEENFGSIIKFPKPPRLNTLTNGDDIYRFMLLSLFQNFLSGSTIATMENSLNQVLSLLATDTRTDEAVSVNNYTTFRFDSSSIELSWQAVQASGGTIIGTATPSDFSISPSGDITVYQYNDANKTIFFSGTVQTGITYTISYFRDNTSYQNTNWMNLTDRNIYSPSPMNLIAGDVPTYNNPEFSYWWNTYNADGDGVVIDQFEITEADSNLIFRLPAKSITFKNPYTNQIVTNSVDFYNLSGTAFDINIINGANPDVEFSDYPQDYQTQVSGRYPNYYVRYSQNNSYDNEALAQFNGSFTKYYKKLRSIEFQSINHGTLDFFEKNSNFDLNDLFGSGTKHIWLNVPWNSAGKYILDDSTFLARPFSLHQDIVWKELFEEDNSTRVYYSHPTGIRTTEAPPNSLEGKEDCLSMFSTLTGTNNTETLYAYPKVSQQAASYANHLEVDFYDNLNTGTTSYIDVFRTGTAGQTYQFRFGMDSGNYVQFSGVSSSPLTLDNSKDFGFVETYFASSGNTNYAITSSANPTGLWTLVAGNIYNTSSSYSYSGITTNQIFPNLAAQQVIDSDYFEAYISTSPSSKTSFELTLNLYKNIGGGLGSRDFFRLGNSVLDNFIRWTKNDNGALTAGVSSIPVPTGSMLLKILRGSYIEVNGIQYDLNSGAFGLQSNHPADFWNNGTLGTSATVTGPNIEPYNPSYGNQRSVIFSPYNQIIQHYVFGNYALRQQFINYITPVSFSIEASGQSIHTPYYYQIAEDGDISTKSKNYITSVPRNKEWNRLTFDFGPTYTRMDVSIGDANIYSSNIGYTGNFAYPISMTLNHSSNQPYTEMSYYDNVEFSYFDKNNIMNKYKFKPVVGNTGLAIIEDNDNFWEGSALDVSAVIDNKYFQLEPAPNFQFNVSIQGLDEDFIYIVNNIINRVKPAHTLVVPIYLLEQSLDTTELDPIVSNESTDWETGNPYYNIQIVASGTSGGDLSGLIKISGLS